ncbi:MAG: HEAT repeat domain-containing protein [Planctomycetota bacterium]
MSVAQAVAAGLICAIAGGCHIAGEPAAPEQAGLGEIPITERTGLREQAFAVLVELAAHPEPLIRANACEALSAWPARLRPVATALIDDENEGVRSVAYVAIGRAGLADLARASGERDESPFVRASAAFARAANGLPTTRSALIAGLLSDPSPRVRSHSALLLGLLGERSAAGPLREALQVMPARVADQESGLFRLQVAEALVRLGEDDQLQVLRAALYPSRPEDLEGTALAATSMGEVGDRGSIDELIYLTERRDESSVPLPAEIRLAAAGSLAKLDVPGSAEFAAAFLDDPDPRIQALACVVVGDAGRAGWAGALEQGLSDLSPQVRVAAAAGVARLLAGEQ